MARVFSGQLIRFRSPFLSHSISTLSSSSSSSSSSYRSSTSSNWAPENRTLRLYHWALKLLKPSRSMRQLYQIQAHLITRGFFQDPFVAGVVLKCASNFGDLNYTVLVFRCIKSPDTFCVNTVIKAYACSNIPHQAVVFYFEMLTDGFVPNSFTFPPLISSCAKAGWVKSGQICHAQATKNGVDRVLPVENSLIHLYACCGSIDFARRVFDEMSVRDLVSWNSIVDGFVKVGEVGKAHEMFDAMRQKNEVSWNIMITGYLNIRNPGWCLKLFREMVKTGLRGSGTTFVNLLTACGRSARLKEGRSVHGFLIRTLLKSSLIIDTALIDMYSKCKRVDVAKLVFDNMPERNLVCWNAMILGHCIHGNPEDGLNLYGKMVEKTCSINREVDCNTNVNTNEKQGHFPDETTFIGVLCACARRGLLTEGKNYFSQMIDLFNIQPSFAHYWCMANLFARVDLQPEAMEILRNMSVSENMSSDSPSWATLLGSCRFQGNVILGEQIAKALIELEPENLSCYALLFNIYAIAGRWEDANRMKQIFKELGVNKIPGCGLFDLMEIVHNLKVGNKLHVQEISIPMVGLVHHLSLSSNDSKRSP